MFEKDTEETFRKNYPEYCCGKELLSPYWDLWQDGAEFGYNKANEWHYPSKGELPEKTGRYLILNRFGGHYFTTNITDYFEGAKVFSTFSMNDIYAWKEIVLPELKESE